MARKKKTHVDVPLRLDADSIAVVERIAALADVTRDQAASVLFALWCVHNLPATQPEPNRE